MTDLIDRQAALDGILQFMPAELKADATSAERINHSAWQCAINCAEMYVRTMPSADIQEDLDNAYQHGWTAAEAEYRNSLRHGYWIELAKCEYRCSICGKTIFADDINERNFCCCCGARMDGEQDE